MFRTTGTRSLGERWLYAGEWVFVHVRNWGRWLGLGMLVLVVALLVIVTSEPRLEREHAMPVTTNWPRRVLPTWVTEPGSQVSGQGLSIDVLEQSASHVPMYAKFEVTFAVDGTAASNLQFPYDADPPPGLEGRVGITVDGLFLPPGESNWSNALVQPAFVYQPYDYEDLNGHDWIYPVGDAVWKLRFAASQPGPWRFKIRAQDVSICPSGSSACTTWVESEEHSFVVTAALDDNPGFVRVSERDPRYFEFSDGEPFIGVGHATDFSGLADARSKLARFGQGRANFFRVWMSASVIFGRGYFLQQWDPWSQDWPTTKEVAPGSDYSTLLDGGNPCIWFWQGDAWPAFEAGKTYKVRIKAKLVGVTGPKTAGQVYGLTASLNNWWDPICDPANVNVYLTQDASGHPIGDAGTQDWHWFEGQFTHAGERMVAGDEGYLVVGLSNTTGGKAYLDEVYIGEDLGDGRIGPNVIGKGKFNYHTYFDQEASWLWDQILDEAAARQIYLKLVIMEKNDGVFNQIQLDGTYDAEYDDFGWNENFYAWPGTKVRRLHEYFWRYMIARWGYSTAVHSWELVNEGAPGCENIHMYHAQALTDYMRAHDPHQHLVTTSFWAGDTDCYYGRDAPFTPDYGDFHAYTTVNGQGTGWLDVNAKDGVAWHLAYSRDVRRNTDVPMVWGEKGIAQENNPDEGEDPRVSQDKEGIWLHNQTWAWLEPGALYTLYWYNDSLDKNDLYPVYKRFRDFMDGIPLSNGHYVEVAATVSNPQVRVLGQEDDRGTAAHFWVQNANHTWWNVVRNNSVPPQSAEIALSGLAPGLFTVEQWDTYQGQVVARWQVEVGTSGEMNLHVDALRTDVAFKIYIEPSQGDVPFPLCLPLVLRSSPS
jgi:hypothetical protein